MSDSPLPDDPLHWPNDPHELLGVTADVSPRELRRAYNRLIRIYKPEQSPEQFRRIREAYETLLRYAELFGSMDEVQAPTPEEGPLILPAPDELSVDAVAEWPPENRAEEATGDDWVALRSLEDDLDELWESAIAGQPASAYERLRQLNRQYAGRTEVYLRLYWLLTLYPELDLRRSPRDWLVEGLLATGMAGPLRELYREEIDDDPAEALGERYDRLLDSSMHASLLADLAEWRFQAGERLRRWDVLVRDVPRLRRQFGPGDERLWLRLVFRLADGVAWAEDGPAVDLLEVCRAEIVRHEYLAGDLSGAFDRFDLLLAASAGLRGLRRKRIPGKLLHLISTSWSRPFEEVRPLLLEVLDTMAGAPMIWLDYLDEMHEHAPTTLALMGEVFTQFEQAQDTALERPRDRASLIGVVQLLLSQPLLQQYVGERSRLLAFCLREAVSPEEIASGFEENWGKGGAAWSKMLMDDWPLRYVCRACRLFWA